MATLVGLVSGASGLVLCLVFFLFVDLGGTVAGTLDSVSFLAALIWAGPVFIHARMVRSPVVALIGGLALLGVTSAFLVAVFRNTSSTAAIGLMTIPILMYPMAVAVLAFDRLVVAWRTHQERPMTGLLRRLLAVALSLVVAISAMFAITGVGLMFDPATREESFLAESVATIVSALVAVAGCLTIKWLWRIRAPASVHPRDGS